MASTPTKLFNLPQSLQGTRPALTATAQVTGIRQDGLSKDKVARAVELHQQYLDSLRGDLTSVISAMSSALVPVTPAVSTSGIISYE